MKVFTPCLVVLLVCGFGLELHGQIASALVRESEPLPGDELGRFVTAISNTAPNGRGGYAFTVITDGSFHHVWGREDRNAEPDVLQSEGMIGDLLITSYESFFGLADTGDVFYGVSATDLVTNEVGLDGVVLNNQYVLNELDPISDLPGFFSTFNSRPGITADGQPFWVGGIADSPGGTTQDRALFLGPDANVLIRGGDSIAGVVELLDMGSSIDFDVRFSACGSNYLMAATLDAAGDSDSIIVTNGVSVFLDGETIREGNPIPVSVGGINDNYDNFDFMAISEYGGKYMITGDSDAAVNADEFVLINGQIVLREGDSVGGLTLSGTIEGAFMTEDGNWTCIWDVDSASGNVEALIANGDLLLREGDPVDWNGDGVIDAGDQGAIIDTFTGISSLTASRALYDGTYRIYFTADVNVGGEIVEGGFEMELDGVDILPADINCDGVITLLDVAPFVKLLSAGVYSPNGDLNQDGDFDLLDVGFFIDVLTGG